jgi:hypothetical protein
LLAYHEPRLSGVMFRHGVGVNGHD